MLSLLLLGLGVVVLSGCLAITEASLFSYSVSKARVKANRGSRLAKNALQMRESPMKPVATLVILGSTVSIVGSIMVGTLAARQFNSWGIGIFSAILTFLTITFGEIIPKNLGERESQNIFPIMALPLRWLVTLLSPLISFFELITKPFTSGASPFVTSEEEIALLTQQGASQGTIEKQEAEMIQRVFHLNDITAGDMMTPRPFTVFIDGEKTVGELASIIKSTPHTRLPVFEQNENNITGIVYQRDLLRALANGENHRKISEFSRQALMVPESRPADDLLRDFQEKRSHLGIVISEYGNIVGVVGLADVLEELVGEIIDERSVAPELIKRISKSEIIAHGQTRISHMNHFFNTEIRSKKTLNGFLLEKFGHIPQKGEKLTVDDLQFLVDEIGPLQIERVRIVKKTEA